VDSIASDSIGLVRSGLAGALASTSTGGDHRRKLVTFAIIIALALHANQIVITLHLLGSLDGSLLGVTLKKNGYVLTLLVRNSYGGVRYINIYIYIYIYYF